MVVHKDGTVRFKPTPTGVLEVLDPFQCCFSMHTGIVLGEIHHVAVAHQPHIFGSIPCQTNNSLVRTELALTPIVEFALHV